jgi:hypothetical protein
MICEEMCVLADCLPYIPDTSYDPGNACLTGTQSVHLNNVFKWSLKDSVNPVL